MPYFTFIASLILPIYSLLLAVPAAIKKKSNKLYLVSIALAFSYIAFCIDPPVGIDLFAHYSRIDSLHGLPFQTAVSSMFSGYFLFDVFAWILNALHLPKQLFPATVVFVSYYIMLRISTNLTNCSSFKTTNFVLSTVFLIFLLNINFISLALGLRSTFSYIIIFYAYCYLINERNIILFILSALVALLIHPSSLIPSILILISFYFSYLSKYSKPLIILAIFLMIFTNLVTSVIEYLDSLASNLPFYSSGSYTSDSGEWGRGYAEHASRRGWIANYIVKFMPVYLSMFYLLIKKTKQDDKLYFLLILGILYIGIFYSYQTFANRYAEFYIFTFSLYLVREQLSNKSKFNLQFLLVYLISLGLIWITNIYSFIDIFFTAKEVFYKPIIFSISGI